MSKLVIIGLMAVFALCAITGCSNGSADSLTSTTFKSTTEESTTLLTATTKPTLTTSLVDVSISFPESFSVYTGAQDNDYGFQRQYRSSYYSTTNLADFLVPKEDLNVWILDELQPTVGVERTEPIVLGFIKTFDVLFEDFERETKNEYLFRLKMNNNMSDEGYEIPNPYLLYTFNLERINDYYSLDPARHTGAREWLEEWLKENEPYESYSAYKRMNP